MTVVDGTVVNNLGKVLRQHPGFGDQKRRFDSSYPDLEGSLIYVEPGPVWGHEIQVR